MHVMHHSTNMDARTHSWNEYDPSDNKNDTFYRRSKILPGIQMANIILHIFLYVHSNMSVIHLVMITQVISHSIAGHHAGAAQCPCQTHQHNFVCIHTILSVL